MLTNSLATMRSIYEDAGLDKKLCHEELRSLTESAKELQIDELHEFLGSTSRTNMLLMGGLHRHRS